MAKLLTKMFLKSELLKDGRLRCIVPPCRAGNFFIYSYLLLSCVLYYAIVNHTKPIV